MRFAPSAAQRRDSLGEGEDANDSMVAACGISIALASSSVSREPARYPASSIIRTISLAGVQRRGPLVSVRKEHANLGCARDASPVLFI